MKLLVATISFAVVFCIWIPGSTGKECVDVLKTATCKFLAKYKACKTHVKRLQNVCRKTCGLCEIETPCKTKKCPYKHVCLVDDNGTPLCKCTVKCEITDKRSGPICARNGKTYKSICLMKMDQCNEQKIIKVYHYGNCINEDKCVDFMPAQCSKLAEKKLCLVSIQLMQFYCPATCRLCRQPAPPPPCFQTLHGCCWNSNKAATGPNQKGCGVCREKPFCPSFKKLCSDFRNIGAMRQACPKTCSYC